MFTYLNKSENQAKLRLLLCDAGLVLGAFLLSYALRVVLYEGESLLRVPGRLSWLVILGIGLHLTSFYIFGLYDRQVQANRKLLCINAFVSAAIASIGIGLLSFAFPEYQIGRILLATHFVLLVVGLCALRGRYGRHVLHSQPKNVAILGWNSLAAKMIKDLNRHDMGYRLKSLVVSPDEPYAPVDIGYSVHRPGSLEAALQVPDTQAVVISRELRSQLSLRRALVDLKFQGLEIFDGATFYERLYSKIPISEISEGWLVFKGQDQPFQPALYKHGKRVMDIAVSLSALILTSPILVFTALLIKLDSKGPVFYTQDRLGQFEKTFTIIKFRTMVSDAETRDGLKWTKENDPRITRIGRILRKLHIDELPQFINVLKGDISVVGTRPFRQQFVDILAEKLPF